MSGLSIWRREGGRYVCFCTRDTDGEKSETSHEAQPCYCGEAKCVGYIGGKTQTDIVTMDDLYLDGAYPSWPPFLLPSAQC